jgi:hypothetical protein
MLANRVHSKVTDRLLLKARCPASSVICWMVGDQETGVVKQGYGN